MPQRDLRDFARLVLRRIESREAEHTAAVEERRDARLTLDELERERADTLREPEGMGDAIERLESAEAYFRSDPAQPHDAAVVAALLDTLHELASES